MLEIGVDMIEIARIENSMKNPKFLKRIFGDKEFLELRKINFLPQSVAANFCAKEAFVKSIGTGFRGVKLSEIEVLRADSGKPYFKLSGEIQKMVREKNLKFSVSLTHTKTHATAVVLCFAAI